MNALLGAVAYGGLVRWELGLGNANKAGAILASACLLFLAWALRTRSGKLRIALLAATAGAGYALLHTFSRGGIVACAVGTLVLLAADRKRLRRLWPGVLALLAVLTAAALWIGAAKRMCTVLPAADASVGNRLALWGAVPRMLAENPEGWGLGKSGEAYRCWYQSPDRDEDYRSLVSSHLTWLVEFPHTWRIGYVAAWLAALALCLLWARRTGNALPLALVLCLATASSFSSVAECRAVWVLPLASFLPTAVRVAASSGGIRRISFVLLASVVAGGVLVFALERAGIRRGDAETPFRVCGSGMCARYVFGSGEPEDWVLLDAADEPAFETVGGPLFGRELRRYLARHPGRSVGLACSADVLPDSVVRLTLCGTSIPVALRQVGRFTRLTELRLLSPRQDEADWRPLVPGNADVLAVYGALSPFASPSSSCLRIPGRRYYLRDWPTLALSPREVVQTSRDPIQ